jgi:monofunctional biosynthetic peptidoglycan transglycosylase
MSEEAAAQPVAGAAPAGGGAAPLHVLRKSSLLSFFFLAFLLGSSFLLLVFIPLPQILLLRWRDPSTTAFIRARQERLRAEGKSDAVDRRPVPLAQVSPALVAAVVAAEDARFYEHHGIDWTAVAEARAYNRRHAKDRRPRVRGASTITQQLAKNLWLSGQRTWGRKAREAAIALALDACVPKKRILEVYLSSVEWGERTYGCEAAARALFAVPASRLTAAQAAKMAAMIPSPRWYRAHAAAWERRAAIIAARAGRGGVPPEEDAEEEARAGLDPALESPQ